MIQSPHSREHAPFRRVKAVAGIVLFHRLFGKLLARAYRNRIPSGGFCFDVGSALVSDETKAALWWGRFETSDCRFIKAYWKRDLDTLQLGAGIGVIATHIARALDPHRLIVCVEANPLLMRLLESNVTANAPHVRKVFVNQAVDYSGAGHVEFASAQDFLHTSLASEGQGPLCRSPAVRLSELVSQYMPGTFQLQMDIEGAEAGVFLSESPLVFQRCCQVLAELHDTVHNGQRLLVEDLIKAARHVHGLQLVGRYGPVVLLRPSRHS